MTQVQRGLQKFINIPFGERVSVPSWLILRLWQGCVQGLPGLTLPLIKDHSKQTELNNLCRCNRSPLTGRSYWSCTWEPIIHILFQVCFCWLAADQNHMTPITNHFIILSADSNSMKMTGECVQKFISYFINKLFVFLRYVRISSCHWTLHQECWSNCKRTAIHFIYSPHEWSSIWILVHGNWNSSES